MKYFKVLYFAVFVILTADLSAIKAPEILNLRQRPDTLGLYEKFEVSFNINNGNEYVNPFDPDEIDITAIFISPSGKQWKVPGFYYYSMGSLWKVRFSPDETGVWNYKISVRDKGGEVTGSQQSFVSVRSLKKVR
jgi:hypothetical protein